MAGLLDALGFGGLAEPDVAGPAVSPSGDKGWTGYLKDPVNRAAMISFGLQAMTGGWGNGVQQAAQALGAGAQGGAGASQAILDQQEAERGRTDDLAAATEDRASRERIAKSSSDTALEKARIMGEYAETRAAIRAAAAAGVKGTDADIYMKAYTTHMSGVKASLKGMDPPTAADEEAAHAAGLKAVARVRAMKEGVDPTSGKSPDSAAGGGPGTGAGDGDPSKITRKTGLGEYLPDITDKRAMPFLAPVGPGKILGPGVGSLVEGYKPGTGVKDPRDKTLTHDGGPVAPEVMGTIIKNPAFIELSRTQAGRNALLSEPKYSAMRPHLEAYFKMNPLAAAPKGAMDLGIP